MGLDMTQLAPSVDGGTLGVTPLDDATQRAAALTVCANAANLDDARDLLTMLGLRRAFLPCGHALDDVVRIKVTATTYRDRCLTCEPRRSR